MKKQITQLLLLLSPIIGYTGTQTVTNSSDSGTGSFRDAVANASSGDTILFDNTLNGSLIPLQTQVSIGKDLTIIGFTGPTTVTLSGSFQTRILSISSGFNVNIINMRFSDGATSSGGAILNSGNLYIEHTTFNYNFAYDNGGTHGGGAIFNNTGGNLTIEECNFDNNRCENNQLGTGIRYTRGGAIYNRGSKVTVNNSFFGFNNSSLNPASATNPISFGGAIYSSSGTINLKSSTFYGNTCTPSDPMVISRGGAIYSNDSLIISFCTFLNNEANDAGSASSLGGNIYNSGTLIMYNSIFAGGSATGGSPNIHNDTGSLFLSYGNNLFTDTSDFGAPVHPNDIVSPATFNSPAQNNSAFTATISFDCSNPAKDAGSSFGAPPFDQAGQLRQFGSQVDIGAFEVQSDKPNVIASVQDPTICVGDTTTVSGFFVGLGTYTWDNGLGFGQAHDVSPTSTTTYTVIGTTNGGCTDTNSVTVTVNTLPNVFITSSDTTLCDNGIIVLTANGADTYTWPGEGVGASLTRNINASKTYSLIGTDTTTGCENQASLAIIVNTSPTPTINVNNDSVLNVTGTYSSYQWYKDSVLITGATSQTYIAKSNGDYYCVVSDTNTCDGFSNEITVVLSTVGITIIENEIKIYPNPTNNFVNINVGKASNYRIQDLSGKTLFMGFISTAKQIDFSKLAKGVYVIEIVNNENRFTSQIVKM